MSFEFFQLLTDEQARQMAREERRAKPVPEEPRGIDVQYKPGIYRYRSKKERRNHVKDTEVFQAPGG